MVALIFTGVSSPMGKIDFIRALDKSSSDDESIWAMDAVGLHPDPVVETTSLEGVTLPQREYAFVLPEETRSRLLSAVQQFKFFSCGSIRISRFARLLSLINFSTLSTMFQVRWMYKVKCMFPIALYS